MATRLGSQAEVKEEVLSRPGRFKVIAENLQAKEVMVGDGERRQRYIVCNPLEAKKDAAVRETSVDRLHRTLEKPGPKAGVGNRGQARFLKAAKGSAAIKQDAAPRDARLDGKFVLRTNTHLSAAEEAQT